MTTYIQMLNDLNRQRWVKPEAKAVGTMLVAAVQYDRDLEALGKRLGDWGTDDVLIMCRAMGLLLDDESVPEPEAGARGAQ